MGDGERRGGCGAETTIIFKIALTNVQTNQVLF